MQTGSISHADGIGISCRRNEDSHADAEVNLMQADSNQNQEIKTEASNKPVESTMHRVGVLCRFRFQDLER